MYHRDVGERPGSWRPIQRRLARRDQRALRLLDSVAEAQGVPVEMLLARSRCRSDVAVARRLAMYLMHVALGRSIVSVAKLFKRHASTVMRGCYVIEDRREDEAFDRMVGYLEARVSATNRKPSALEEPRHAG